MAPLEASGMLSFARRTVSLAISVRRLLRVARWWAFTQSCSSARRPRESSGGSLPLLVIPDHANHCDDHRHDWPSGEACDQNKQRELGNIIPACFRAQEFTA